MSLQSVHAEYDAEYKAAVMASTWGHLEPERGRNYKGVIIFAHAMWGGESVIDWKFEDLSGSPGFSSDIADFVSQHLRYDADYGVYKFVGKYRRSMRGRPTFTGTVVPITISLED